MRATIAALALGPLVACSGGATTSTTGLSGGSSPGTSGGEGTGSSAGTEASTSSGSASGSAGSTSESSAASSTTPVLDMGLVPDLEDPTPAGCEGKIDFLFVINRESTMEDVYPTLLAGFPGFMATIEEAFADFDYHILVANPAPAWGEPLKCPSIAGKCPIDGGCDAIDEPNYPCWVNYTSGVIAMCDWTLGAGMLFPAGKQATNHPCKLKGGQRYIQKGEPDLLAAFECIASLGISGGSNEQGWAAAQAVSRELNDPGGCNEGFLRDDALLVVTVISDFTDFLSPYNPYVWANAIIDAKGGDQDAIVGLALLVEPNSDKPECGEGIGSDPWPLRQMFLYFDHHVIGSVCAPSYEPLFAEAAELALDVCDVYVPQ